MQLAERLRAARALEPVVAATRAEMDAEGRLSGPVVEGLRATGALRAAVPAELDGP